MSACRARAPSDRHNAARRHLGRCRRAKTRPRNARVTLASFQLAQQSADARPTEKDRSVDSQSTVASDRLRARRTPGKCAHPCSARRLENSSYLSVDSFTTSEYVIESRTSVTPSLETGRVRACSISYSTALAPSAVLWCLSSSEFSWLRHVSTTWGAEGNPRLRLERRSL